MRLEPKLTATMVAAARVHGLTFWSAHPMPGHLWALDRYNRVHVVAVRTGVAYHDHDACDSHVEAAARLARINNGVSIDGADLGYGARSVYLAKSYGKSISAPRSAGEAREQIALALSVEGAYV